MGFCNRKILDMLWLGALLLMVGFHAELRAQPQETNPSRQPPAAQAALHSQVVTPRLILTQALLTGRVQWGPSAHISFKAVIQGHQYGQGWAQTVLFKRPVALAKVQLPAGVELCARAGMTVISQRRGPCQITLQFDSRLRQQRQGLTYDLPLPVAGITRLQLQLPARPALRVRTIPGCVVEQHGQMVTIFPPARDHLTLQLQEIKAPQQSVYHVRQHILLNAAPNLLMAENSVTIRPVLGQVKSLAIKLPPAYQLLGVLGTSLQSWRQNGDELQVQLQPADHTCLSLKLLLAYHGDLRRVFSVPCCSFPQARHVAGTLEIKVPENTTLSEEKIQHIHRVSTARRKLSYRFDQGNYLLRLVLKQSPLLYDVACETLQEIWPDVIRLTCRLRLQVLSGKLHQCHLSFPAGFTPLAVRGANLTSWSRSRKGVNLFFRGAAHYQVQLEGFLPIKSSTPPLVVPWIPQARTCSGHLGVKAHGQYGLEIEHTKGLLRTPMHQLPRWMSQPTLAFRYSGRAPAGRLRFVKFAPVLQAQAVTLAELTNRAVMAETRLRIQVRQAPLFEYSLSLRPGITVEDVSGTEVSDFEQKGSHLRVMLAHPITPSSRVPAKVELRILLNRPYHATPQLSMPLMRLEHSEHFQGVLVMRSRVAKELLYQPTPGLTEIQPQQLPFSWFRLLPRDILVAYRQAKLARFQVRTIKPEYHARSMTLYTVGLGMAHGNSRVNISVDRAYLSRLTLRLPPGVTNIRVRGNNIKRTEYQQNRVTVVLSSKVSTAQDLILDFDLPLKRGLGQLNLTPPRILGATGHDGRLAFRNTHEIQLSEGYQALHDLVRVPATIAGFPNMYLFRSGMRSPCLKLLIAKVQRQAKAPAKARQCRLHSIMAEDGSLITTMMIEVINRSKKQYLQVYLPAKAQLWGAYVAAKPVKAGYGQDGALLIPLNAVRNQAAITVQLIYQQPRAHLVDLQLQAPRLDITTGAVEWQVALPPGYQVLTADGNMDLVRSPQQHPLSLAGLLWRSYANLWAVLRPLGVLLSWLVYLVGWICLALLCWFILAWLARWLMGGALSSWIKPLLATASISILLFGIYLLFVPRLCKSSSQSYRLSQSTGNYERLNNLCGCAPSQPQEGARMRAAGEVVPRQMLRSRLKKGLPPAPPVPVPNALPSSSAGAVPRPVVVQKGWAADEVKVKKQCQRRLIIRPEQEKELARREMHLASRYLQQGQYQKARRLFKKQLKINGLARQARDALRNLDQLQEESTDQKVPNQISRAVNKIREEYLDRALAQATVAGHSKDRFTKRLIETKLVQAENRLLRLPDSPERRRALKDIENTRRRLRGQSHGQDSQDFELGSWAHRRDKIARQLRRELRRRNYHARVIEYGNKLVVLGNAAARRWAGQFIAGLRRRARRKMLAQQGRWRPAGRAPAGKALVLPKFQFANIQQADRNLLSVVKGGRARGALPVAICLPRNLKVYTFQTALVSKSVPNIQLRCLPVNVSPLGVVLLLLLGLAALQVMGRIKQRRHLAKSRANCQAILLQVMGRIKQRRHQRQPGQNKS